MDDLNEYDITKINDDNVTFADRKSIEEPTLNNNTLLRMYGNFNEKSILRNEMTD